MREGSRAEAAFALLEGEVTLSTKRRQGSGRNMPSTLSEDTAPSASLGRLKAQAAPTHPGEQPE